MFRPLFWAIIRCQLNLRKLYSVIYKMNICYTHTHTQTHTHIYIYIYIYTHTYIYTGLFISPSGISELDCATTKTDTADRSISIGRESLQFFFVLGALAYFQVPPLGGSRDEKWRSQ